MLETAPHIPPPLAKPLVPATPAQRWADLWLFIAAHLSDTPPAPDVQVNIGDDLLDKAGLRAEVARLSQEADATLEDERAGHEVSPGPQSVGVDVHMLDYDFVVALKDALCNPERTPARRNNDALAMLQAELDARGNGTPPGAYVGPSDLPVTMATEDPEADDMRAEIAFLKERVTQQQNALNSIHHMAKTMDVIAGMATGLGT